MRGGFFLPTLFKLKVAAFEQCHQFIIGGGF